MSERGFRLPNGIVYNLQWLFTRSDADISGLGAQKYATSSGSTAPDRLLLQESMVEGRVGELVELRSHLLAAAEEMLRYVGEELLPRETAEEMWGWLRRVYGHPADAHLCDNFGRELGPLVAITPAARAAARREWPEHHVETNLSHYDPRGTSRVVHGERVFDPDTVARILRGMPGVCFNAAPPDSWELEAAARSALDRAWKELADARRYQKPIPSRSASLVREVERQAEVMLATATEVYGKALAAVRAREREEEKRAAKDDRREADETDSFSAQWDRMMANLFPHYQPRS